MPARFGKYLLVQRIAQGGMAEIFKAKSYGISGFEKTVVIKRILPTIAEDRQFVKMMIDEAKICASLQHANIVQIFDLGRQQGQYFIAMEFVDGLSLSRVISVLAKLGILLPVELCCFVLTEALAGLDYAHRATTSDGAALHLVHRDFNPGNILLSFKGDVKVADFGIAKSQSHGAVTEVGLLKGKLGYMSPEQVVGEKLDGRSDVFTAGITLWEMLTGRRMYSSGSELDILLATRQGTIPDVTQYNPDVPERLVDILHMAMQRDNRERLNAAAFRATLLEFLYTYKPKVSGTELGHFLQKIFAYHIKQEQARAKAQQRIITRLTPPKYLLRRQGQQEQGPYGMRKLSELISSGELGAYDEVRREDGSWLMVNDVPELALQLAKLPSREETNPDTKPRYQGHFPEVSVAKLLYRLAISSGSGRLVLTRPAVQKEVYFRDGKPEFVKSDMLPERLGEFLVYRKVITEPQRDQAIAEMKAYSGRLGDTLIGLGILQPHELFEHLTSQVREKLLEVFSWHSGSYYFFPGQSYTGEVVPLKIGGMALLVSGIRSYLPVEMVQQRFESRSRFCASLLDNSFVSLEELALTPREQKTVDLIDGARTIQVILEMLGANVDEYDTVPYRTFYMLEELELLKVTGLNEK